MAEVKQVLDVLLKPFEIKMFCVNLRKSRKKFLKKLSILEKGIDENPENWVTQGGRISRKYAGV